MIHRLFIAIVAQALPTRQPGMPSTDQLAVKKVHRLDTHPFFMPPERGQADDDA